MAMDKRAFFGIAALLMSSSAFATGGMEGGGGKSVVCRDSFGFGKITSAEVLDLYEARIQYGLSNVTDKNAPYMDTALQVLSELGAGRGKEFTDRLIQTAKLIDNNKRILPLGTALQDVDDSHEVIIPKGCQVEQLAHFLSTESILINGEIWASLDEINKAALIVHETIYMYFRQYGATDSVHARKAVGYGFSGAKFEPVDADVPPSAVKCETDPTASPYIRTEFWIYPDASQPGKDIVQFDSIGGVLMLTRSYFRALSGQFGEPNNFTSYQTPITYSLLERQLPVGFRNVMTVGDASVQVQLFAGAGRSSTNPTTSIVCDFSHSNVNR